MVRRQIQDGDWRRPALVIFGLAVVAMIAILVWVGRWLTVWFDEWNFIFDRQTLNLDSFIVPHVDGFVALPAAVYYVILHVWGLGSYFPFLIADWIAHLACVGLLGYIVARKSGVIIFGVVLILIQAGNTFVGRPPSSNRAFAITALIFYTLFAGIAFLLEKRQSEPDWQC